MHFGLFLSRLVSSPFKNSEFRVNVVQYERSSVFVLIRVVRSTFVLGSLVLEYRYVHAHMFACGFQIFTYFDDISKLLGAVVGVYSINTVLVLHSYVE